MTLPLASVTVRVLLGSALPLSWVPSAENRRLAGAPGGVVSFGLPGRLGLPPLSLPPPLLLPPPLSMPPSPSPLLPPPPPPPPPPAASAMPPATATPPSAHGQIAASPADAVVVPASRASMEAIDWYCSAAIGSAIHHSAPLSSSSTSWLIPLSPLTKKFLTVIVSPSVSLTIRSFPLRLYSRMSARSALIFTMEESFSVT
ncbi:hypothetical protein C2U54_22640 [Leclercia sp. LSNIH1]|nr:hypothetical protein C2U54_22640 [Leclercia sp. LSNIH1]POV33702.1 hypothetical protein C3388_16130 [Leclercia sp. LSNIH5]POW65963.1 hypothetical protein C3389_13125 [Leclercia sp. LSNIH2]